MQFNMMCQVADQYNYSGFTNHINLTSFPGHSEVVPGMANVMDMNSFYIPLRGTSSPYAQNKHLPKSEEKLPKNDIPKLSDSQTSTNSQTGFGSTTDKVLESLNEGQKHKLEDNVYNAMTNPVIKVKKIKLEAAVPTIKKTEKRQLPVVQMGQGNKKVKKTHKFTVI